MRFYGRSCAIFVAKGITKILQFDWFLFTSSVLCQPWSTTSTSVKSRHQLRPVTVSCPRYFSAWARLKQAETTASPSPPADDIPRGWPASPARHQQQRHPLRSTTVYPGRLESCNHCPPTVPFFSCQSQWCMCNRYVLRICGSSEYVAIKVISFFLFVKF